MISFNPIEPHIKVNNLIDQDFYINIFKKYRFLRSSFLNDVPLVFLKMTGNDRNSENISQFLMEIKLQISTLQSIKDQKLADKSILRYYIENVLKNLEINLSIYYKHNKEALDYKSVISHHTASIIQNNILYADRDIVKNRNYRAADKPKLQNSENVSNYSKYVPELLFYRFYNSKEIESIRALKTNREYYRDRELKSIEFRSSREFIERIIKKDIESIGSRITLSKEGIWNNIYSLTEAYVKLPAYIRTYRIFNRVAGRSMAAYRELLLKQVIEEKLREANNSTLVYEEHDRNVAINNKEINNIREFEDNKEYYRDRELKSSREFRSSREFIERIIKKDIESIGNRITLAKEGIWNSIYSLTEAYVNLPVYRRTYRIFNRVAGRNMPAYREFPQKQVRKEKLREVNNNTVIYEGTDISTAIYNSLVKEPALRQSGTVNKQWISIIQNRDYRASEKIEPQNIENVSGYSKYMPGLLFFRSHDSREIDNIRELKNNKEYYRDRELKSSRESKSSREFIERIIKKDIESIGSRITLAKEGIWNSIYSLTEAYVSLPVYSRTYRIFNRVAGRNMLAYREFPQKQVRKEKLREVNNNTFIYEGTDRSTAIYNSLVKEPALRQPRILNHQGINIITGNDITENNQYAENINIQHNSRNINENIFRMLYVLRELAANRNISVFHGVHAGQPGNLNIFENPKTSYKKSYFKRHRINRVDNILKENVYKRNITVVEKLEEKLSLINFAKEPPLMFEKRYSQQSRHDYNMSSPNMDNLKNKKSNSNDGSVNSSVHPQAKAHVDLEIPKNEEINISKNQMQNIVNKVFSEIEKKIEFERYRRGL